MQCLKHGYLISLFAKSPARSVRRSCPYHSQPDRRICFRLFSSSPVSLCQSATSAPDVGTGTAHTPRISSFSAFLWTHARKQQAKSLFVNDHESSSSKFLHYLFDKIGILTATGQPLIHGFVGLYCSADNAAPHSSIAISFVWQATSSKLFLLTSPGSGQAFPLFQ